MSRFQRERRDFKILYVLQFSNRTDYRICQETMKFLVLGSGEYNLDTNSNSKKFILFMKTKLYLALGVYCNG